MSELIITQDAIAQFVKNNQDEIINIVLDMATPEQLSHALSHIFKKNYHTVDLLFCFQDIIEKFIDTEHIAMVCFNRRGIVIPFLQREEKNQMLSKFLTFFYNDRPRPGDRKSTEFWSLVAVATLRQFARQLDEFIN